MDVRILYRIPQSFFFPPIQIVNGRQRDVLRKKPVQTFIVKETESGSENSTWGLSK
jgi:hypothetical protein